MQYTYLKQKDVLLGIDAVNTLDSTTYTSNVFDIAMMDQLDFYVQHDVHEAASKYTFVLETTDSPTGAYFCQEIAGAVTAGVETISLHSLEYSPSAAASFHFGFNRVNGRKARLKVTCAGGVETSEGHDGDYLTVTGIRAGI